MRVLHIAFECAPMFKTGGLGDVVGSLPIALSRLGMQVQVAMPGYSFMDHPTFLPGSKVAVHYMPTTYFKSPDDLRDKKKGPMGFAEFVSNLIDHLRTSGEVYDVIHCHDWHMGLLPLYVAHHRDEFKKTKTIITIHNVGYQGNIFQKDLNHAKYAEILKLLPDDQKISFLKIGIDNVDLVTTVSPHHALEIKGKKIGANLSSAILDAPGRFYGILNGIDYETWNPHKDPLIHLQYDSENLKNKHENKLFLQKQLRLRSANVPLFAFVGRLSIQKGIDLLIPQLAHITKLGGQFVLLGSGDELYEHKLASLKKILDPKSCSLQLQFNEELAHQIYAAADFILIPSIYEPCGLIQMIAMGYGTVPIASKVGGLVDSIEQGKTGFLFEPLTKTAFKNAISHAVKIYNEGIAYQLMQKAAMKVDFSWDKSAAEYARIYKKLVGK